jgi:hypothetical protein
MKPLTQKQHIIDGAILGAAYGVFARFVFGRGVLENFFEVMSCAFIIGVPIALGFITVWFTDYRRTNRWGVWIVAPWLASVTCLVCALALVWEGLICVILLLPIEQLQSINSQVRTVQTQIKIHASPQIVWDQIKSVRFISEKEQSFSFTHMIGFPQPLDAKLVGQRVGAVRLATFEKGVLFIETINEWDEPHRLSFSIRADTKDIPPTTFDEHVIIGGKYFDVLNGTYSIEDIGNGDVILHLSSSQRLSTRFNFYSHF